MKKNYSVFGITALFLSLSSLGEASATATQNLTMIINSTSNITVSGNPATLSVTLNPDGTGNAVDNSTTYTVVSNTGVKGSLKVTGQITSGGDMPTNTTLTANLASKAGTSAGALALNSTKTVDLVTALPTLLSDTGAISYGFSVVNGWTVAAQTLSRTVTLTLTSGS